MSPAKVESDAIGAAGQSAGRFAAQVLHRHVQRRQASGEAEEEQGPSYQEEKPPHLSLQFAMPAAPLSPLSGPEPSQTATQDTAEAGQKPAPGSADARAVADRVYDLMKQEIVIGRARGQGRRSR